MTILKNKFDAEQALRRDIATFVGDPLGYVMYAFPWEREEIIQQVPMPKFYQDKFKCEHGPDEWAIDFLEDWGRIIHETADEWRGRLETDPMAQRLPQRFSTVSGHGIGKSAMAAWITKFIMDTRPLSRGTVTANTAEQLRTKTWAQIGFWHNMSLTRHWFKFRSGRGSMMMASTMHYPNGAPMSGDWQCSAQSCRDENAQSFAGQHAPQGTSFYLFDEASEVSDGIFVVREGGLTDGEPMVFDFGNPTKNSGAFFENSVGVNKHRYNVRQIDSRDVFITNKEVHKQWIEDYGVDSDFVKVRILGEFPSQGSLQFIASRYVDEAQNRPDFAGHNHWPLVIGVDVAGTGPDGDKTVLTPRIGPDARSFPSRSYRGLDPVQIAGKVTEMVHDFHRLGKKTRMIFVDAGGGNGVEAILRHSGYPVRAVYFGGAPSDNMSYRYKGDEMWGRMKNAIRDELILPRHAEENGMELYNQLTQRDFGFTVNGGKIHLETKADMKKRLGSDSSPDDADSLALTYAEELAPDFEDIDRDPNAGKVISDFDPLEQ